MDDVQFDLLALGSVGILVAELAELHQLVELRGVSDRRYVGRFDGIAGLVDRLESARELLFHLLDLLGRRFVLHQAVEHFPNVLRFEGATDGLEALAHGGELSMGELRCF